MIGTTQDVFAPVFDAATRGGYGAAARAIDAAIAKHGESETPLHHALGAVRRGIHAINEGRYEDALRAIIPALEELERSAFNRRLGWLHSMVGFAVGMMGNPERGLEWTGRALAALGATPASVDSFNAHCNHGCLLGMAGEHDASRRSLEQALALAISAEDLANQFIALSNIAYGLLMRLQEGEALSAPQRKSLANQALKYAERARALDCSADLGLDPVGMDSVVGQAMLHAGDVAGARTMFAHALEVGPTHPPVRVDVHLGVAVVHRLGREFADARVHVRIAHELASAAQLGLALDRVMIEGIALETAAGNRAGVLDWTTRRCEFLERHYKQRLRLLARSAELATAADSISRRASDYQHEAESLSTKTRGWDDEHLRDALTQAFNRKGLARVAGHIFAPFRQLATIVIDIDHFTAINEACGRTAGDTLLQRVAEAIAAQMRNADQFARAEGGEFQVLLLDATPTAAFETCERIRTAVERGRWIRAQPDTGITVSIGICNRSSEKTFEATLAAADRALAQAKKSGRNRTCVA